jgi:DNA-binding beta-propeller fold protein YncE
MSKGAAALLVSLCSATDPRHLVNRLDRIDQPGSAAMAVSTDSIDMPVALSVDGKTTYIADHRYQRIWALDTRSGRPLWSEEYGKRPPVPRNKLVRSPKQIVPALDGGKLYLISNWTDDPSPGVYVIDANSGRETQHILGDKSVTGIAVDAVGNLFVASLDAGGTITVLPDGDETRARTLRSGLGGRLSGLVYVG